MEIPVITRVSDFEATINSLTSNSPSRLFSILQLGRFSTAILARLLISKWIPLLFALIYALSSVARKITIRRRHRVIKDSLRQPLSTSDYESDDDSTDNDTDDEDEIEDEEDPNLITSSSNFPSDDERYDESSSSNPFLATFHEDFQGSSNGHPPGQKRKFKIRRKRSMTSVDNLFSLAELVNGNSVVKFWDGLGLGLDFHNYNSSSSANYASSSRHVQIGSVLGQVPAVSMSSPTVVFMATSDGGKVGLSSWDVRLRRRKPTMEMEWKWPLNMAKIVAVNAGGVDKVYVTSSSSRVGCYSDTVVGGDMRKAGSPLENVTELYGGRGDTLWDVDGNR